MAKVSLCSAQRAYSGMLSSMLQSVSVPQTFLKLPFSKSSVFLWQTVMLTYGSLVYRNCAYYTPCSNTTVQVIKQENHCAQWYRWRFKKNSRPSHQPLNVMAEESLKTRNESEMVIALKALGNAGHPGSIKTIMRFLPGISASTKVLPPSVLSAAVQSLRLIAPRDPHSVREQRMSGNDSQTYIRWLFNTPFFRSRTSPWNCSCRRPSPPNSGCWLSSSCLRPSRPWLWCPLWRLSCGRRKTLTWSALHTPT